MAIHAMVWVYYKELIIIITTFTYRITQNFHSSTVSYYFVIKNIFVVAHDGPKDHACDGDY